MVPSPQAEPLPSCNGWRSQLVALHVDNRTVKTVRQWRTLGRGRKCKTTYLSRTMYLRHRVQTQAVCQPSYRFHSANFLIVKRNVFGLLHTVHARGCHCKGCFLNDWVELRNVACQVPMMSQLSLSPRIFGVCIQGLVALVRFIHATFHAKGLDQQTPYGPHQSKLRISRTRMRTSRCRIFRCPAMKQAIEVTLVSNSFLFEWS